MNRAKMPLVKSFLLSLLSFFSLPFVAEGELVIKSHIISKGYLDFDNSAFTIGSDGAVTFRTGDVYGRSAEQRLIWKGRKEDYIQVRSFFV
jgi:long-subunit acyl-CoA synthetase (AMP-forming)